MNQHKIQKRIAALGAAAALTAACIPVQSASAAEKTSVVFLGDSITSGYGLKNGEAGYYDYIADCLDASVTNYAVPGYTTTDLLTLLDDTSKTATIKSADIICISIGGNDLLKPAKAHFESKQKPGETLIELLKRLAKETSAQSVISDLTAVLRDPKNNTPPRYAVIEEKLRALNPNAQIIMQTIYNPFEVPESYYEKYKLTEKNIKDYKDLLNYVSNYEKLLNKAMLALETVKTADVSAAFAGSGWLYARVLESDIHPTALGHALIAAKILDQIEGVNIKSERFTKTLNAVDADTAKTIPADDLTLLKKYSKPVTEPEVTTGDADGDKTVTSGDAQLVLNAYADIVAGNALKLTDAQKKAADVNKDGNISVEDAQFILTYYVQNTVAGIPTTWEQIIGK